MRFVVRDGMGIAFGIGIDSFHQGFLATKIKEGDVVYDLGGNRGQMALFFSRQVGKAGRVISFEPVAELADDLELNCKLNALLNVTCIRAAVADFEGEAVFDYSAASNTQGKLTDVERSYRLPDISQFKVDTLSLNSILGDFPAPNLIKIDVEGAAQKALRGAGTLLDRFRPSIFIEHHGPEERRAIQDELVSRGYRAYALNGDLVTDVCENWVNPLWCEV